MDGADIADVEQLGILPAQHFDKTWPLETRLMIHMARVTAKNDDDGSVDFDKATLGHLGGAFVMKNARGAGEGREVPVWAFATPVELEGSSSARPIKEPGGRSGWKGDAGLEPVRVTSPAGATFPAGWQGAVVAGTSFDDQNLFFIPAFHGLVAAHYGGPGSVSTRVFDTSPSGDRIAPLHSKMRLYKQGGGKPKTQEKPGTGSNGGGGGAGGGAGGGGKIERGPNGFDQARGRETDSGSAGTEFGGFGLDGKKFGDPSPGDGADGSPPGPNGGGGNGNGGAGNANPHEGKAGGLGLAWQLGLGVDGVWGRGVVSDEGGFGVPPPRVHGAEESKGPDDGSAYLAAMDAATSKHEVDAKNGKDPKTQDKSAGPKPQTLAAMSVWEGGPIDVGNDHDIHELWENGDKEKCNGAHISTAALFRYPGGAFDAPLEFRKELYKQPVGANSSVRIELAEGTLELEAGINPPGGPGGPFILPVYCAFDPAAKHKFKDKVLNGLWRWYTEGTFYLAGRLKRRKKPVRPPATPGVPPTDPRPVPTPGIPGNPGGGGSGGGTTTGGGVGGGEGGGVPPTSPDNPPPFVGGSSWTGTVYGPSTQPVDGPSDGPVDDPGSYLNPQPYHDPFVGTTMAVGVPEILIRPVTGQDGTDYRYSVDVSAAQIEEIDTRAAVIVRFTGVAGPDYIEPPCTGTFSGGTATGTVWVTPGDYDAGRVAQGVPTSPTGDDSTVFIGTVTGRSFFGSGTPTSTGKIGDGWVFGGEDPSTYVVTKTDTDGNIAEVPGLAIDDDSSTASVYGERVVTVPAEGTAGDVPQDDGAGGVTWGPVSSTVTLPAGYYGNRASGNHTLTGNDTLFGDMHADEVDLNGFMLFTAGFKLYAQKLTMNGGALNCTGGAGGDAVNGFPGAAGQGANAGSPGSLGYGGNGSDGAPVAAGVYATLAGQSWANSYGGAGGKGADWGGVAGAGGTTSLPAATAGRLQDYISGTTGVLLSRDGLTVLNGGAGGSGGSGSAAGWGGGGGGGGGRMVVAVRELVEGSAPGHFYVTGGAGGNAFGAGGGGASGGGGGGGGAGDVVFVYQTADFDPVAAANVDGGAGGTGAGLAGNGADGADGTATRMAA